MNAILDPERIFRLPRFTYSGLLLFLVVFFILTPFFSEGNYARLALDLSLIYLLAVSVFMCSNDRRFLIIALILALPGTLRIFYPTMEIEVVTICFNCLFFAFVIFTLLRAVFSTHVITRDIIFAAISVYILVGIFYGLAFILLEYFVPGSFSGVEHEGETYSFYTEFGEDMIYYSFVTLTTLGYGDISPVTQPAKFLSILEALIGQIYLTVMIARLIGLHLKYEQS